MTESFFKNEPKENPTKNIPDLNNETSESNSKKGMDSDTFQSEESRISAIMSYIPILCFVPLLNIKDNPEARFHARQGVLLFLVELVAAIFLIDGISDFVFKAILLIAVAFSIVGIYFAVQGKSYRLPVVGDLADKTKL